MLNNDANERHSASQNKFILLEAQYTKSKENKHDLNYLQDQPLLFQFFQYQQGQLGHHQISNAVLLLVSDNTLTKTKTKVFIIRFFLKLFYCFQSVMINI